MHQKSQSAEKRGIPTAYCENTVINLLKKLFPNGFIHADEFARIDPTLSMSIRKYARNCGMTYPDWLRWKGFVWGDKNTGYLETDMQVYSPQKNPLVLTRISLRLLITFFRLLLFLVSTFFLTMKKNYSTKLPVMYSENYL